jgi:hypothetical protein
MNGEVVLTSNIRAIFVLLLVVFCGGCVVHYSSKTWASPRFEVVGRERDGRLTGEWEAERNSFNGAPFTSSTWATLQFTIGSKMPPVISVGPSAILRDWTKPLARRTNHFILSLEMKLGEVTLSGARGKNFQAVEPNRFRLYRERSDSAKEVWR